MADEWTDRLDKTKTKLDAISPSFCGAKWNDVTIHLHNGRTHSCHHPGTHRIPLDELGSNPSVLHNTPFKKEQRKAMLAGERPAECDYCWRIEDLRGAHHSDRLLKSNDLHTVNLLDRFAVMPWDANVTPAYVEVSFSNVCNFKCSYCSPVVSSKWVEEINQFGPYPTSTNFNDLEFLRTTEQMPFLEREHNPYVDAWWQWWPELYETLEVFRVTGGEPLLSKHTFRMLDYVIDHPRPSLGLAINSNLGVPDELIDRFIEKVQRITAGGNVKYFQIYTSVDTWGKEAEYIRHGLDIATFERNIHKIFDACPLVQIHIMCTFNCLSVFNFEQLLRFVGDIKQRYYNENRFHKEAMSLDIAYLRWPEHQSVKVFEGRFADLMRNHLAWMEAHSERVLGRHRGFFESEIDKLRRLIEYYRAPSDPVWLARTQSDFVKFFDEHDRRRGTDLLDTFPDLADFIADVSWRS